MLPSLDPDPRSGLAQLRDRSIALGLALAIGAIVAVSAVGFFRIVGSATAFWAQPLPHSLDQAAGSYAVPVALALGLSALIAGKSCVD